MKIGILTYHRSQNHGALLQAIALRYILQKFGNEVYFVDYYPEYHQQMYDILPNKSIFWMFKHPKTALSLILKCPNRYRRSRINDQFLKKYVVPYCKSMDESYDVVVYGSDQIWRKQPGINEYNPVYFGKNKINALLHVSYAASINNLPDSDTDKNYFRELLTHLDKISVRESSLRSFVNDLGFNCVQSLDPTLLMTNIDWDSLFPTKNISNKPYLLYYKVSDGLDESEIENYAKQHGLEFKALYCATLKKDSLNRISVASADTFVDLIRNAKIVITTSFHGMVFSINYHKQFYVHCNNGAIRIMSVLESLGLKNRWIDNMCDIQTDYSTINYVEVDKRMSSMKKDSLSYLAHIKEI